MLSEPSRIWAIIENQKHDLMTVPVSELETGAAPSAMVNVIRPDQLPDGVFEKTLHVRENAQEFDVHYYRFPRHHGLLHGRGGNWIVWSNDLAQFSVTETANNPAQTWVHARFLLRHLIVDQFLMQTGYRRIHAAGGTLLNRTGLLIAGPYLSGKTYLLNALIERGLLLDWVEDDCAVVDADLTLHALIPLPDTVCQTRRLQLTIILCLDKSCTHVEPMSTRDALQWALNLQASWPVSWLPHHSQISTDISPFKRDLLCLRVPECPTPEDVITALQRYMESPLK